MRGIRRTLGVAARPEDGAQRPWRRGRFPNLDSRSALMFASYACSAAARPACWRNLPASAASCAGTGYLGALALAWQVRALAASRNRRDASAAQDLGHAHMRDLKAEPEFLALNAAVAPARVLSGQLKDQLPPPRVAVRAWAWRASVEGGPFATDQIAMPAE